MCKKNKFIMAVAMLLTVTGVMAQGGVKLYGVNPFEGDATNSGGLFTINQQTGEFTSVTSITESGDFKETIAMALDTSDQKTVYVVYEDDGNTSTRTLGTLNLSTGVITSIGLLGDAISDIAFDANGQLYGITGDGGDVSNTLFSIDKSTGSITNIVTMDSDLGDGESLGYNFNDGMMYRRSGNGETENELTVIDLSNPVPSSALINSTDPSGEGLSLLFDIDTGLFLESDRNEALSTVNPSTLEKSVIGSDPGGNYLRGLMFFPSKQDLIFYDGFNISPPPPVN